MPPTTALEESPALPHEQVSESLLVFSDVHLGSDLNDRLKGEPRAVKRSEKIDRDLVSFLQHYSKEPPRADRWRVVIAGDFVDFIGISIDSDSVASGTDLNEEERAHGLGNSADHAREKLRRVAARHGEVFEALAAFVARGHALTVVHGNHDVEFHWDEVRADFRQVLLEKSGLDGPAAEAFVERIEFNNWFYYWGGVAYIEHGHQYDPYCVTENLMAPMSALDPRRIARGFCDVLLRFVVRPTNGMREHGHESMGLWDYISFGAKLGFGGMATLGYRFYCAVRELFRIRREQLSRSSRSLRALHFKRAIAFGAKLRVGKRRLRQLLALQARPITRTIRGIMASVLLDRLALAFSAMVLLTVFLVLGTQWKSFLYGALAVPFAWGVGHWYFSRQRKLDPTTELAERATHLATLLPAAIIVMGHTHAPAQVSMNNGAAQYINVGSWAEEEDDPEATAASHYRAPRTHLVIHLSEGQPVAELRSWDSESDGPRAWVG